MCQNVSKPLPPIDMSEVFPSNILFFARQNPVPRLRAGMRLNSKLVRRAPTTSKIPSSCHNRHPSILNTFSLTLSQKPALKTVVYCDNQNKLNVMEQKNKDLQQQLTK